MNPPEIVLRYSRDITSELCTGELILRSGGVETQDKFSRIFFTRVLAKLAALIKVADVKAVIVERTDRTGFLPVLLEVDVVELLKQDPVAAIRHFSPTGMSSTRMYTPKKKEEPLPPAPVFKLGYDTLADAIGDYIYSQRNKAGELECPGCGFWRSAKLGLFKCSNCSFTAPVRETLTWARFKTVDVLDAPNNRFFFPRKWNRNGVWIFKEDLRALYEEWLQEKGNR